MDSDHPTIATLSDKLIKKGKPLALVNQLPNWDCFRKILQIKLQLYAPIATTEYIEEEFENL